MRVEYVRLSDAEVYYGKKHFLNSELELLNLIKSFRQYRQLRKEELILKIALKNKITEALANLSELDKKLPKTHLKLEKESKDKRKEERRLSLEEEIFEVRRKLEQLHRNMW